MSTDIFQPSPVDEAEVRLKIEEIVLHPDYGVVTQHDSDIAVLKVATPDTPLAPETRYGQHVTPLLLMTMVTRRIQRWWAGEP